MVAAEGARAGCRARFSPGRFERSWLLAPTTSLRLPGGSGCSVPGCCIAPCRRWQSPGTFRRRMVMSGGTGTRRWTLRTSSWTLSGAVSGSLIWRSARRTTPAWSGRSGPTCILDRVEAMTTQQLDHIRRQRGLLEGRVAAIRAALEALGTATASAPSAEGPYRLTTGSQHDQSTTASSPISSRSSSSWTRQPRQPTSPQSAATAGVLQRWHLHRHRRRARRAPPGTSPRGTRNWRVPPTRRWRCSSSADPRRWPPHRRSGTHSPASRLVKTWRCSSASRPWPPRPWMLLIRQ